MPAEVWVGRAKAEETQERAREGKAGISKDSGKGDPGRERSGAGKTQSGGNPRMVDLRQLERPKERRPRAGETQGEDSVRSSLNTHPSAVSVDGAAVRIRISTVFSFPSKDGVRYDGHPHTQDLTPSQLSI